VPFFRISAAKVQDNPDIVSLRRHAATSVWTWLYCRGSSALPPGDRQIQSCRVRASCASCKYTGTPVV